MSGAAGRTAAAIRQQRIQQAQGGGHSSGKKGFVEGACLASKDIEDFETMLLEIQEPEVFAEAIASGQIAW